MSSSMFGLIAPIIVSKIPIIKNGIRITVMVLLRLKLYTVEIETNITYMKYSRNAPRRITASSAPSIALIAEIISISIEYTIAVWNPTEIRGLMCFLSSRSSATIPKKPYSR